MRYQDMRYEDINSRRYELISTFLLFHYRDIAFGLGRRYYVTVHHYTTFTKSKFYKG